MPNTPRLHLHHGAHPQGPDHAAFRVWAPFAKSVALISDETNWTPVPMQRDANGIWETEHQATHGTRYKFRIHGADDRVTERADPYGRWSEPPPLSASRVLHSKHQWSDDAWMQKRSMGPGERLSIYEVHLGSWMQKPDGGLHTYTEITERLLDHVKGLGFTHIELMPITEHPYLPSWGYQTVGYFSPTARYGDPDELKGLVDAFHQAGIGVILDWVPSHFAVDGHGLVKFDGTALYEHPDERRGFHPDWNSYIFDYGRPEVHDFLLSSALYWLEIFHLDAIRVDAVASMLYLDYSREDGQWAPNQHGGKENLEAIQFLQDLCRTVHAEVPGAAVIAEESTAWQGVTHPEGLGFDLKWDMGWMHDTLAYLANDPIHRKHDHNKLTFRGLYAWNERFLLPLSHDEVVHGKGSLVNKMPGDDWQQFANLRLLFVLQWTMPGPPLLFMGGELATRDEWNHDREIDWSLLQHPRHQGMSALVGALNHVVAEHPALHTWDHRAEGFEWVLADDWESSVYAYKRVDSHGEVLVVVNATPVPREEFAIPWHKAVTPVLNTDDVRFGGSGYHDDPAEITPHEGTLRLTLPPLSVLILVQP